MDKTTNKNLTWEKRTGAPKWKGHYLSYYLPYRDPRVHGWAPEEGYNVGDKETAQERKKELEKAMRAISKATKNEDS